MSEIKRVVEDLITDLQKRGIGVTDAAILSLDKGKTAPAQPVGKEGVKRAIDGLLSALREKNLSNRTSETATGVDEEPCMCNSCFNFETFEEKLKPYGGTFDYTTVKLGGKIFDIKYHICDKGESVMFSPQNQPEVDPTWTVEQVQTQLNEAVQNKQFDKAQVLLNALNNLKSKN